MIKSIRGLIIEIIITLFLVVVSYVLCDDLNNRLSSSSVKNNSVSVEIIKSNKTMLYPMTDSYARNNVDDTVLNILNYNNDDINCRLLMLIEKEEDLNYNNLKIKVDEDIFSLDKRYLYEDDSYLYFDLAHREIDKNKNISFAMWLDENTNDLSNYNFTYNFLVEKI